MSMISKDNFYEHILGSVYWKDKNGVYLGANDHAAQMVSLKSSAELVGKTTEDGHKKEGFDEMFGMNVVKFTDKVVFTQKVKVKKGTKSIKGVVNYMCCDSEMCLPPKDVSFEILL